MLLGRVRRTLSARRLLSGADRVLVACSGGPDSVALTHALARLGPELGFTVDVAAVDHGIRPEAKGEVARVGELAHALGLPFHPLAVTVDAARPSLQAAARRARYRALLELGRHLGVRRVAVGHTRDDQAETVLARLLRGAGIDGLSGIAPLRGDGVCRPLIDCRRRDVEAHARRHRLPVVRDPSNDDPRFLRSRVRHRLLPPLIAEDPRLVEHLAALADEARIARREARAEAGAWLEALDRSGGGELARSLDVAELHRLRPAVRGHVLRTWVRAVTAKNLSRAHLEGLASLSTPRSEILLPGGWAARVVSGEKGRALVLDYRSGRRARGGVGASCPRPSGSPDAGSR